MCGWDTVIYVCTFLELLYPRRNGNRWQSGIIIFDWEVGNALFCIIGTLGIGIIPGKCFRYPGLDIPLPLPRANPRRIHGKLY